MTDSTEDKPMAEVNEMEQSKEPIRSDMIVRDVILAHPDAAEVLMRVGMGCISCPAALMESLGDACAVHGLDGEEVVKYLNQELNLPQA
jgi:hybrid cluster-associated redox disulfide protein